MEALARDASQRMDVGLALSMRTAGVREGWSRSDYQSEYQSILDSLSDCLEAPLIDGDRWYKDNQFLYYEDRIVVPEARVDGYLQWARLSSADAGCRRSVEIFRECHQVDYCPHAYRTLKGRPRMVRSVEPLFNLPFGSALRSLRERTEFNKLVCLIGRFCNSQFSSGQRRAEDRENVARRAAALGSSHLGGMY